MIQAFVQLKTANTKLDSSQKANIKESKKMIKLLSTLISKSEDRNEYNFILHLYEQHYKLWRYKALTIVDADSADDIIQSVFTNIIASRLEFLSSLSEEKQIGYIVKSIINEANKYKIKQQRLIPIENPEAYQSTTEQSDPAQVYNKKLSFEEFVHAFEHLSPKHQNLIYFKFFENLPDADIALLLGLQPASLRSALTRARRALQKEIAKEISNE